MPRARRQPSLPPLPSGRDEDIVHSFDIAPATRSPIGRTARDLLDQAERHHGPEARARLERRMAEARAVPVPGARAGQVFETMPIPGDANGRRYQRSVHVLDMMQRRGALSVAQTRAGFALVDAWEATQKGPSRNFAQERVDQSSPPTEAALIVLERQQRWAKLMRAVPAEAHQVVHHVCCEGHSLRDGLAKDGHSATRLLEVLRMALDILNDENKI